MTESPTTAMLLINPFTTGDEVLIPHGRSKTGKVIHVYSTTEHYAYAQLSFDGETVEIIPGELVYSTGQMKWSKVSLTEEIIRMNNLIPSYREVTI